MLRFQLVLVLVVALTILTLMAGCATQNPGTSNGNTVVISTDQSLYRPTDVIQVTVTNNLKASIYALDAKASCSILFLVTQVNNLWQSSAVARCPLGRPSLPQRIDPGQSYKVSIQAGYPGLAQETFPSGTYRLELTYFTSEKDISSPTNQGITVYSAILHVEGGPPTTTPSSSGATPISVPPSPTS